MRTERWRVPRLPISEVWLCILQPHSKSFILTWWFRSRQNGSSERVLAKHCSGSISGALLTQGRSSRSLTVGDTLYCTWTHRQLLPADVRKHFKDLDHLLRDLASSATSRLLIVSPYLSGVGLSGLRDSL